MHIRALFAGVLALLTLPVFWDVCRSPPTMEPDDFARGVIEICKEAGGDIVRAVATDGRYGGRQEGHRK